MTGREEPESPTPRYCLIIKLIEDKNLDDVFFMKKMAQSP